MHTFVVDAVSARKRLDVFVHDQLPQFSRSFIGKLIEQEAVHVNGAKSGAGDAVHTGDVVKVDFDESKLTVPDIVLPILYEDDDCIVINKPAGILTHSKGAFNPEATVATFIAPKIKGMVDDRAGIVHRLDRATSGVIICAKTPEALQWLQKQFSSRKVKKQYVAVVRGILEPDSAVIDMPIGRNPRAPKTFYVTTNGRPAQTIYKVSKHYNNYSLLELTPQTGRTHQLRVHLRQLRHPIVGDTLYGGESYDRMLLHAHKLELTLPNKQRREFIAPIPKAFHTVGV